MEPVSYEDALRWFGYEPGEEVTIQDLRLGLHDWRRETNLGPDHDYYILMTEAYYVLQKIIDPNSNTPPYLDEYHFKAEEEDQFFKEKKERERLEQNHIAQEAKAEPNPRQKEDVVDYSQIVAAASLPQDYLPTEKAKLEVLSNVMDAFEPLTPEEQTSEKILQRLKIFHDWDQKLRPWKWGGQSKKEALTTIHNMAYEIIHARRQFAKILEYRRKQKEIKQNKAAIKKGQASLGANGLPLDAYGFEIPFRYAKYGLSFKGAIREAGIENHWRTLLTEICGFGQGWNRSTFLEERQQLERGYMPLMDKDRAKLVIKDFLGRLEERFQQGGYKNEDILDWEQPYVELEPIIIQEDIAETATLKIREEEARQQKEQEDRERSRLEAQEAARKLKKQKEEEREEREEQLRLAQEEAEQALEAAEAEQAQITAEREQAEQDVLDAQERKKAALLEQQRQQAEELQKQVEKLNELPSAPSDEMSLEHARKVFGYPADYIPTKIEHRDKYREFLDKNLPDILQEEIDTAYAVLMKIAA